VNNTLIKRTPAVAGLCACFALAATAQVLPYIIDPAVKPFQDSLPDRGYGIRPLAAVEDQGHIIVFVANEVLYTPASPGALQDFLKRYDGKVVDNNSIPSPPAGMTRVRDMPATPLSYTITLNSSGYNPQFFVEDAQAQGLKVSTLRFSSDTASRLVALVLHEQSLGSQVELNSISQPSGYIYQVPKNNNQVTASGGQS